MVFFMKLLGCAEIHIVWKLRVTAQKKTDHFLNGFWRAHGTKSKISRAGTLKKRMQ